MNALGDALLVRARNAIGGEFGLPARAEPAHARMDEPGATFVTLIDRGDALRGCIGSLEPWRPLDADVRANARAAAFGDPRFPPLRQGELPATRIEVSLLGPAAPIGFADKADACRQLRPGIDGVILEYGRHRGTFLPQVWESLAEPEAFLAHLMQKAGLPGDFWSPDLVLRRYEVQKWKEAATTN